MTEDLCEIADMEKRDLPNIWEALSKSQKVTSRKPVRSVTKKDFVEGVISGKQQATEMSVRRIEKDLAEIKWMISQNSALPS